MTGTGRRYYRARATGPQDVTFGRSANNNVQIAIPFQITEGERAGDTLTWLGTFTDAAQDITLRGMRAAGWSSDDIADPAGIGDKDVDLVVEDEVYNGKTRERVKFINEPGGGKFKFQTPVERTELRALSAQMKGAAISSRSPQQGGKPVPTASNGGRPSFSGPQREPAPAGSDDGEPIPF